MRIRRRTAVALCVLAVLATVGGAALFLLQPERIRRAIRDALQARLAPGWTVELDEASYDLSEGVLGAGGLRLLREGELVARVPRVEVASRPWQLVGHGRITDIRLQSPEITVERREDGTIPLLEAFRAPEGEPAEGHPRVRVSSGLVRLVDPSVLAPGTAALLEIRSLDLQESRSGAPATLEAVLVETGDPREGGRGALGRVLVRGEVPPGRRGLHMLVERFDADPFLMDRLAPALRERIEGIVSLDGTFGSGPESPGLEVSLSREAGGGGLSYRVRVRPRDLNLVVTGGFPALFTGVTGDATLEDGRLSIGELVLRRGRAEFHLRGHLESLDPEAPGNLEFWARDLYLDHGLRDSLPPEVRRVWDAYDMSGVVDVTAAERGAPGSFDSRVRRETRGGPLRVAVTARLRDGEMSYRGYEDADGVRHGFDYPVTRITGRVDVTSDGDATTIDLKDLEGFHGDTRVTANGKVVEFGPRRTRAEVTIVGEELELDDAVRDASPVMAEHFRRFSPAGTVRLVTVVVQQDPNLHTSAHETVTLELDGRASFAYERFPLRLEEVRGTVRAGAVQVGSDFVPNLALSGIRGRNGEGRYAVDGSVEGAGDARVNVTVTGEEVVLGGALEEALRASAARNAVEAWDRVRPGGRARLRAEITGTESRTEERIRLDLLGASAGGWGDIRFPVRDLEGTVEIGPDAVELRGLRGANDDGAVTVEGTVRDPGGDARLDLTVTAEATLLDGTLRERLGAAAERAEGYFSFVKPAPGLRGNASVRIAGPAAEPEVSVAVEAIRGGVRPLDLRNLDLGGGTARYEGGVVVLEGIAGSMADRQLVVDRARLDLDRGEGSLAVSVRKLRFAQDLVGLLTEETAAAFERLAPDRYFHVPDLRISLSDRWRRVVLDGTLSLSPREEDAHAGLDMEGEFGLEGLTFVRGEEGDPRVALSGAIRVRDAVVAPGIRLEHIDGRLDLAGTLGEGVTEVTAALTGARATFEGRHLERAAGTLTLAGGRFRVTDLRGTFAEGALSARVEAGEGVPAYAGRVSVSNAHARALFTPTDPGSRIRGRVDVFLDFENRPGTFAGHRGEGRVDLRQGRLFEVPVFASLLTLPTAPWDITDTPAFESGKLSFHLAEDRIIVDEILLDSRKLALHESVGRSTIYLDGRLDVSLRPEIKDLTGIPYPFKLLVDIPNVILKPVLPRVVKIHVGGTFSNPKVTTPLFDWLFTGEKDRLVLKPPPTFSRPERRPAIDF